MRKKIHCILALLLMCTAMTGCSSGDDDFTVLTTPYKQILTIGIIENGVEAKYIDPAEFQDFCYAMNNIQTLYKLSEDSLPSSGIELHITTRNQKYRLVLDSPNIRIGETWFVVDDDTKTFTDIMQDISINHQVKN